MTIPQELRQFVDGAVASGKYRSPEEVVATALRMLQEREQKLMALRSDIAIGIAQLDRGEGLAVADEQAHLAFFDDIDRRGHQRLATKNTAK
jgi:antitoxin ParD1/3/4